MLECQEVPRLPRKTTFAASPIDTAMAPESQRPETRHVGASKRTFRARLPQMSGGKNPYIYFSSNPTWLPHGLPRCFRNQSFSFRRASAKTCLSWINIYWNRLPRPFRDRTISVGSASTCFRGRRRARLPSIFITCHKMPRPARNLHLVTTSRSADNAIRKKHATRHVESAALALRNHIGGLQSAAPATKNTTHLLKTLQKYCACHAKRLLTRHDTCWNVTKCHACHAKRSDATLKNYKKASFCRTYHIGTAIATLRERLRTVADGCERLGDVWRTQLNPQTPRVKREPLLRIREKIERRFRKQCKHREGNAIEKNDAAARILPAGHESM